MPLQIGRNPGNLRAKGSRLAALIGPLLLVFSGSSPDGFTTQEAVAHLRIHSGNGAVQRPKIILWAWERPEILDFIDPREVGVAFLAKTLSLRDDSVVEHPRLQPLRVPPGTTLTAVVRIMPDRSTPPHLSFGQAEKASSRIAELTRLPGISAIQIDFDARVSERTFHRELLVELRRRLPASVGLSVTALASWCLQDNWLSELPVDEAVPMLFRMGPEGSQVRLHLERGREFRSALCRRSVGISTDEPRPRLPTGRQVYIFHPRPWSSEAARDIIQEVRR